MIDKEYLKNYEFHSIIQRYDRDNKIIVKFRNKKNFYEFLYYDYTKAPYDITTNTTLYNIVRFKDDDMINDLFGNQNLPLEEVKENDTSI